MTLKVDPFVRAFLVRCRLQLETLSEVPAKRECEHLDCGKS